MLDTAPQPKREFTIGEAVSWRGTGPHKSRDIHGTVVHVGRLFLKVHGRANKGGSRETLIERARILPATRN